MPTLAAVRLPAGWSPGSDNEGSAADGAVAGPVRRHPGDPIVFHRSTPLPSGGVPIVVAATVAGLDDRYDELQVLDRSPVAARRGSAGERLLTTWRDGARSVTAEHWLLAHEDRLHVLAAVMDTRCYAATAEAVRRSFGTFCPGRSTSFGASADGGALPAQVPPRADVVLAVEVLAGRRTGVGAAAVRGQVAVVDLPGRDVRCRTSLPVALVPSWLAGLVELGPRPRPAVPGSLVLGRAALDGLLDESANRHPNRPAHGARHGEGRAVPAVWRDALAGARDDVVTHWRLSVLSTEPEPPAQAGGVLEVLDLGPRGLWRLDTADETWLAAELADEPAPGDPVVVSATNPTAVWEALSAHDHG